MQLKNEMKQTKKLSQTCHICNIIARNIACLISYLVFCFERLNHVQRLNLEHSKTRELSSI